MMKKWIAWLEENRLIAAMMATAYYLAVVIGHDSVTRLAIRLRRALSVEGYNLFFTLATLLLFAAWMAWLSGKKFRKGQAALIGWFLVPTLVLSAVSFLHMMTYSIEAVHFFQYALLLALLLPLARSYGGAVFLATVLGILDELHQYLVLTPQFRYLDFNDILLNLLGAGLASVTIRMVSGRLFGRHEVLRAARWSGLLILLTGVLFALFYFSGHIRWYPGPEGGPPTWFSINRGPAPAGFWTEVYPGRSIHILGQWEGSVLVLALLGWYFLLDFFPGPPKKSQ